MLLQIRIKFLVPASRFKVIRSVASFPSVPKARWPITIFGKALSIAYWLLPLALLVLIFTLALIGRGEGDGRFTYQLAVPGRKITFPAAHYSHPNFKTEWWYYTGHLESASGRRYGYQLTFFRFGLRDRQKSAEQKPLFTDLYMAHFALSDIANKKFFFRERINRGYDQRAGAATDRYRVWNDDWSVEGRDKIHVIEAKDRIASLTLKLTSLKPPVLHGNNGLSQKAEGEGRASYYYSLTRLMTEGELTVGGKTERVRGLSWMDHEFGSNQLAENQAGWDWFSIQLNDSTELMLYIMRRKDGTVDPYSSGTAIVSDDRTRHLELKDFRIDILDRWKSPESGAAYPMKWKISVPSEALVLDVLPEFPNQELNTRRSTGVTYWEGAVQISGTRQNRPVRGQGYVEMTGYVEKPML
jgi:predicted secreted hydrolase